MKLIFAPLAILALACAPAYSKGCIKGAAVGGVAGHFVGHGHVIAGAAIGCAVGHHRAAVQARQQRAAAQTQAPARPAH